MGKKETCLLGISLTNYIYLECFLISPNVFCQMTSIAILHLFEFVPTFLVCSSISNLIPRFGVYIHILELNSDLTILQRWFWITCCYSLSLLIFLPVSLVLPQWIYFLAFKITFHKDLCYCYPPSSSLQVNTTIFMVTLIQVKVHLPIFKQFSAAHYFFCCSLHFLNLYFVMSEIIGGTQITEI